MSRLRSILDIVVACSMLTASVVVIWTQLERAPRGARASLVVKGERLDFKAAPTTGRIDAPVVVMVFSDFQCPYCAQFATETLPALVADFVNPGRIRLVFRHLPLRNHPLARQAAVEAQCAAARGMFWEYHDALFALKGRFDPPQLGIVGRDLKLGSAWEACRGQAEGEAVAQVAWDLAEAARLKIQSTPTFVLGKNQGGDFIATSALQGARPLADLAEAVEAVKQQ